MRILIAAGAALSLTSPAAAASPEAAEVRTFHAGRFTATITPTVAGERLNVHRVRRNGHRRRVASRLHARGRFTRVVLDESGVAAYLAVRTLPSGRKRVLVRTTDDPVVGRHDQGPDIDRRTLGLAGSAVLWRRGGDLRVRMLSEDTDTGSPARAAGACASEGWRRFGWRAT